MGIGYKEGTPPYSLSPGEERFWADQVQKGSGPPSSLRGEVGVRGESNSLTHFRLTLAEHKKFISHLGKTSSSVACHSERGEDFRIFNKFSVLHCDHDDRKIVLARASSLSTSWSY
jgi:hypothetical protein